MIFPIVSFSYLREAKGKMMIFHFATEFPLATSC